LCIDFLNKVKAFLVPYTNTMCIIEKGQPCVVYVKREIDEDKILFAIQFSNEIKKKELTFFVVLKFDW